MHWGEIQYVKTHLSIFSSPIEARRKEVFSVDTQIESFEKQNGDLPSVFERTKWKKTKKKKAVPGHPVGGVCQWLC